MKLAKTGLAKELLSSQEEAQRTIVTESCKQAYLTREEVTGQHAEGCISGLVLFNTFISSVVTEGGRTLMPFVGSRVKHHVSTNEDLIIVWKELDPLD